MLFSHPSTKRAAKTVNQHYTQDFPIYKPHTMTNQLMPTPETSENYMQFRAGWGFQGRHGCPWPPRRAERTKRQSPGAKVLSRCRVSSPPYDSEMGLERATTYAGNLPCRASMNGSIFARYKELHGDFGGLEIV